MDGNILKRMTAYNIRERDDNCNIEGHSCELCCTDEGSNIENCNILISKERFMKLDHPNQAAHTGTLII